VPSISLEPAEEAQDIRNGPDAIIIKRRPEKRYFTAKADVRGAEAGIIKT
jgi:hypothetical protein